MSENLIVDCFIVNLKFIFEKVDDGFGKEVVLTLNKKKFMNLAKKGY